MTEFVISMSSVSLDLSSPVQSRTLRFSLFHFIALLLCILCGFLNVVTINCKPSS